LVRYLADGAVTPPTIVVSGGQCLAQNEATGAVSLRVSSPNAVVSAISSNQELIPDANLSVSGTGQDRRLGIVAAAARSGTATVTVAAQGDDGMTSLTIDVVVGTTDPDVLVSGEGPDVLFGLHGADMLHGRGGADLLCGGNGADRLDGGDGDDGLFGQNGSDALSGGAAADHFSGGRGADVLVDLQRAEGDTTDGS
jgi:Ca2+-binding RTX toxin-like protein